jgi:hypothetical protein
MKETRKSTRRAPNATEEILHSLWTMERQVGKLLTNDRGLIKQEIGKLRDLILKCTRGLERRKVDRRA